MKDESPQPRTADASLPIENTFKHPEGLLTARNLVRLLLAHTMEDKQSRGHQGLQQTLTDSFHMPRSIPGHNPIMSDTLKQYLTFADSQAMSKKRKNVVQHESQKKPRLDKTPRAKRLPKPKAQKKELAKYKLDHAVWMRILEFAPPQFLGKARLICNEFKSMVDGFTSIYVNCRRENYGHDMPPPPLGLTERQYSNLLGSKGCLEPDCPDKGASRTHWSWAKRWCVKCWRSKIEREDRLIKNRADRMGNRTTFMKLLECIPVGMHDSFMKPHDYVDVEDNRPRGAPRLYKYYLKEEVEKVIERYDNLTPEPFRQDPTKTAEENTDALARYQDEMSKIDEKRTNWLATEKAKIDEHMALVQRIEAGVRQRRENHRTPYDNNRNARKELFTRRAKEDLPHIEEEFIKNSTAFKAATRVFRDGGTERGWQTLKPKIEKEWASRWRTKQGATPNRDSPLTDGAADDFLAPDGDSLDRMDNESMLTAIDNNQNVTSGTNITGFGRMDSRSFLGSYNMAQMFRRAPALPPPSSMRLNNATRIEGLGNTDFDDVFDNSQPRHSRNNIPRLGSLRRDISLGRSSAPQWPYSTRALPPPSYITSTSSSMSHGYVSHMPASSNLSTGPVFPGVIPATATLSNTSTRNISISSLVNKIDQ